MDIVRTVLGVVVAVLVIVATVAMVVGDGEPGGIRETMTFLAAGGATIGAIISQVLEDFEWFQNLTSAGRELVVKLFTFGLPLVGGVIVAILPAQIPWPFNQLWALAVMAVLMFLGAQLYHKLVTKRA